MDHPGVVAAGYEAVIDRVERRSRDGRCRTCSAPDEVDDLLPALGARQMREADVSHGASLSALLGGRWQVVLRGPGHHPERFQDSRRQFVFLVRGGEKALPEKEDLLEEVVDALQRWRGLQIKYRGFDGARRSVRIEPLRPDLFSARDLQTIVKLQKKCRSRPVSRDGSTLSGGEREMRSTALNPDTFSTSADPGHPSKTTAPDASWAQNDHSLRVQLTLPVVSAGLFLEAAEALILRGGREGESTVSVDAIRHGQVPDCV